MDIKEYQKQYRLKNKDKLRASNKEYYFNNKERIKPIQKKYRDANKDKIRERDKKYRLKNKDRIRKYKIKNRDRDRETKNIWSQSHQLTFLGKRITLDNIERTLSCMCCRFQGKTDLHHLKYDLSNPLKYTVELCDSCHVMWHLEEHYLKYGKKGVLPSKELIIENTMNLEEGIGGAGDGL
jgi:hypothetical protein